MIKRVYSILKKFIGITIGKNLQVSLYGFQLASLRTIGVFYVLKKVLIFYSKTGGGHLRAAEAIAEGLQATTPKLEVILVDGLAKNNFNLNFPDPGKTYGLLSHQLLWFYNLSYLLTNNPLGSSILRNLIHSIIGTSLHKTISEISPNLIVSTHFIISPGTINEYPKAIPFVTVVTDLINPHQIWFDKKSSMIITPTEKMADYARELVDDTSGKNTVTLDYPIKNHFKTISTKRGFSHTLLILGGGVGSMQMKKQIIELLKNLHDKKIIAVCGYNQPLKGYLEDLKDPRLKVFGFVHNMHELIAASDIVLTKAGPAAIIEAAISKKPLIITGWVGLQEKDNVQYVLEEKLGVYCPKVKKLPEAVENLYKNYPDFTAHRFKFTAGASKIALFLQEFFKIN